jgi:Fe-S-cluster containining protein
MFEALADQVQAAAKRAEVRDAVREIYARLQQQVDQRKPVCVASGRCCKFEEYGHRLYVTTMELAAFVHGLTEIEKEPETAVAGGRALPVAPSADGCPFQIGKLCGVHAIRPFGCRIFYCDPSATDWQQRQYETFHAELKRLHEQFGVPYFYLEWRQALGILGV